MNALKTLLRHALALGDLAAALLALPASAQYAGPDSRRGANAAPVRSVAAALQAADDTPVELEGRLIRQVGKEKYIFSDGQADIRVDIDDEDFPTGSGRIDEHTRVRLHGEVEKDFLESPEIDVDRVTVLGQ